jgi:hypothetical protein
MKKSTAVRSWRVIEIRKKGHPIGTFKGRDADAAIATAVKEYGITDPHRLHRLIAQPIE